MACKHIQVVSFFRNHLWSFTGLIGFWQKWQKVWRPALLHCLGVVVGHLRDGSHAQWYWWIHRFENFWLEYEHNALRWWNLAGKKLHPIAYSLSKLTGSGLFGLVRTKELFLRWAEYSVFSPIMRTHEVCLTSSWGHFRFSFPTFKLIVNNRVSHQGNEPESFHQFYSDEDTMFQFGRLTQIFTTLKNYTKVASPFFSQCFQF